ncbi:hypothetical protein [Sulfitobacter guttiformis]|uniref:Uncharacterized protein n=1 Tax=Sulfitobacter guttiformis TaxID=74349 RepID=A0A420DU35_9RHOB|nr:hypothetical protein [Sulfitobacter guttiformis]KIN71150.1 hypothetical protein Z949_307 [Sulfitobacter guttiformis KCTC 32187]RKE97627.1 hypothetical protein C8N30_2241 [Sulfitobacter guttiformis]
MALTAKERKQNQLAREQEELRKQPDSTFEFLDTPFYQAVEDGMSLSDVELMFDLMGLEPPVFEDDRGPTAFASDVCFLTDEDRDEAYQGYAGSIGRAEVMVDHLMDAAIELAGVIKHYKKHALKKKRAEIEAADLSDPDKRREALHTITRIARIEEALDKNVRRTLPQWMVKGI